MKPICIPCRRFFKPKKNGFYFIEGMPTGDGGTKPGNAAPELWQPYKLWCGDLWECPGCGTQIIHGTGSQQVSEHYKEDFHKQVAATGAEFQVNDC